MHILFLCFVAAFAVDREGSVHSEVPLEADGWGGVGLGGAMSWADVVGQDSMQDEDEAFQEAVRQSMDTLSQQQRMESQHQACRIKAAAEVIKHAAPKLLEQRLKSASDEVKFLVAVITDKVSPDAMYGLSVETLFEMASYLRDALHLFPCGDAALKEYHHKGDERKMQAIVEAIGLLPVEYQIECPIERDSIWVGAVCSCQFCKKFFGPNVEKFSNTRCPFCRGALPIR